MQRKLDLLGRDPQAARVEPETKLKPGTRLLREWNGKPHSVQVVEDGLMFEERLYRSLSLLLSLAEFERKVTSERIRDKSLQTR